MYNHFHPPFTAKETEKSSNEFNVTELVSEAELGFGPRQSHVGGQALNHSSASPVLLWNGEGSGFRSAECHVAKAPSTRPAVGLATPFFHNLSIAKL